MRTRNAWYSPRALDPDRVIVATCLLLAAALAWMWMWRHQAAPEMAGMSGMAMPQPPLLATFAMWALMMVAMMLPSALPMILLHARLMKATPAPRGARLAVTGLFALVYLLVWAAASFVAAVTQHRLVASGAVSAGRLALGDPAIAGCLLIAAGLYQLTPLKTLCLERCRSPLSFLMQGWRPDMAGAIQLGLRHGLYCLGCCWLLMALLFVGGVINLGWVALLAFIVLAEKLFPGGRVIALGVGVAAVIWGTLLAAYGLNVV